MINIILEGKKLDLLKGLTPETVVEIHWDAPSLNFFYEQSGDLFHHSVGLYGTGYGKLKAPVSDFIRGQKFQRVHLCTQDISAKKLKTEDVQVLVSLDAQHEPSSVEGQIHELAFISNREKAVSADYRWLAKLLKSKEQIQVEKDLMMPLPGTLSSQKVIDAIKPMRCKKIFISQSGNYICFSNADTHVWIKSNKEN